MEILRSVVVVHTDHRNDVITQFGTRYHHEPYANGFIANVIVLLFYGLDESKTMKLVKLLFICFL